MKKGRELISLPIYCKIMDKEIGEIKDLICNYNTNVVDALVVQDQGWLKGGKVINYFDVEFGKEFVTIENLNVIKNCKTDENAAALWNNRQSIYGSKIFNKALEFIGSIEDVLIDEEKGNIIGYEISESLVEDLLQGRQSLLLSEIEKLQYIIKTES